MDRVVITPRITLGKSVSILVGNSVWFSVYSSVGGSVRSSVDLFSMDTN